MALSVLLGPAGIAILLPPFSGLPVRWHGILIQQLFVTASVMLLGRWHQSSINDLATTGDEALLEQLRRYTIEQGLGTGFTDAIFKVPNRGAIRNIDGLGQPAEALIAHSVQQLVLHLFIRQVIEARSEERRVGKECRTRWEA